MKAEGDVKVGVNVIRRALEEPFRQIVFNAGREASVLLNDIKLKGGNWGYDVRTGGDEPVDMIEAGIIDPAKVTKQALLNAILDRRPDAHHRSSHLRDQGRREGRRR